MTELIQRINIVKILNFPIADNKVTEIDVDMQLDLDNGFCRCDISEPIKKLINDKQIILNELYETTALYVIDDSGEKYTLFNFSYKYEKNMHFEEYISTFYYSVLFNAHMESWDKLEIDKVETTVKYRKAIGIDFNYQNIHIKTESQYSKENLTKEDLDFLGEDSHGEYTGNIKIIFDGKQTFKQAEPLMWRLSEFFLLIYEDMFFYDTFDLSYKDKTYKLKSYGRSNTSELRKDTLRTKNGTCWSYCLGALYDLENNFAKFIEFREKSGIIFDVFRSTVYSKSFREDYPLRLSQTMEGLANYIGIVDTNKKDTFCSAIQLSLYCNDYIKEYLPETADIINFGKAITKHRNMFSHIKYKGDYLKGNENERFAEILYTTLRIIMIKRISGKL